MPDGRINAMFVRLAGCSSKSCVISSVSAAQWQWPTRWYKTLKWYLGRVTYRAMQRLLCCQEVEMGSMADVEEGGRLVVDGGDGRDVMQSEGDVQREMESLQREVEASKASVIAMDKRRKTELEKAEEKRKSEVQVVEERRRKEREELEGEVGGGNSQVQIYLTSG